MPIAYEGTEPYIFVSYAHKDSFFVMPVIRRLQREGFRVWYDEGIEAGSEWPDYIAAHLKHSTCVISMVSDHFAQSMFCRQELTYAQKYRIAMLTVYMEDVVLPDGLEMQLSSSQAMFRDRFETEEAFLEKLCSAKILQSCRMPEKEPTEEEIPEYEETDYEPPVHSPMRKVLDALKITVPDDEYEDDEEDPVIPPEDPPEKEQNPGSKGWNRILSWMTVGIEFSYLFLGPLAMEKITAASANPWARIFLMALPHMLLALAVILLIAVTRKKTEVKTRSDALFGNIFLCPLFSLIAVIPSVVRVQTDVNLLLKFLIALGLNILPAIGAMLIYIIYVSCAAEFRNELSTDEEDEIFLEGFSFDNSKDDKE